jgi:hypothetical protein
VNVFETVYVIGAAISAVILAIDITIDEADWSRRMVSFPDPGEPLRIETEHVVSGILMGLVTAFVWPVGVPAYFLAFRTRRG